MSFTIASLKGKINYFFTSTIVVLKAWCKVRTEPKSGIPESKPEPYNANLEAPIFSVHRAALIRYDSIKPEKTIKSKICKIIIKIYISENLFKK